MPSFNILVVGGGLGGLVTALALSLKGHKVTVLESTSKLQTIGGGISVQPNACRAFDSMGPGMVDKVRAAGEIEGEKPVNFYRYNGEYLFEMGTRFAAYGYQTINIHRANFQRMLVEEATKAGVVLVMDARVEKIDDTGETPVAFTKDGKKWEADLIIGADGCKSKVRSMMYPDITLQSSINCYRAVISGDVLREEPELNVLFEKPRIYWGPERIVVAIPVQNGKMFNLECAHPGDTGTAGEWTKKGDVDQFKQTYSDFDPLLQKLMAKVKPEDLLVWKLVQLPELESWRMKSGKVCLIADAAHAVTPFAAQGHAMAVEDGVCLAECLARAKSTADIPQALEAFETIRKPRVKLVGALAGRNEHMWRLPDGPAQQQRDEAMRRVAYGAVQQWDGNHIDETPGLAPDPRFFPWLFGHDTVGYTNRTLDKIWT